MQQLGDIDLKVEGNGLLQAQIRERTKTKPLIQKAKPAMIAATIPHTITAEYAELNRKLHQTDPSYGISGSKRADTVRKLIESVKPGDNPRLRVRKGDIGFGFGSTDLGIRPLHTRKGFPPAASRPGDLHGCFGHVEPECLDSMLLDLSRCTLKVCYVVINTGPAMKSLADGRNAHLIQRQLPEWKETLARFFAVASIEQNGSEIFAVLGPKPKEKQTTKPPPLDLSNRITPVRHDGTEVKFYTPNKTTHWRAQSLFAKEPSTIEWIETFQPGEVFYDVGANVGGYSVWAAKRRGVKVFAFEPHAENYAILCRNLKLNEVDGVAYCLALTDTLKVSNLFVISPEVGGACNTFHEPLGHDLKNREGALLPQGCVGISLDLLAKHLPAPDHIKIDVDGLEHMVVAGASSVLHTAKSLLVEVNGNLEEHRKMVEHLQSLGFFFDPQQVERATRKEGAFKGCAEYVFRKVPTGFIDFSKVVIQNEPFQWFYAENVFPPSVFEKMRDNMPEAWTPIEKSRGVKGYPLRFTASPTTPFWLDLFAQLQNGRLKKTLCDLFGVKDADNLTDECLLVRDFAGYKIGPHTDSPIKVITVLFYIPKETLREAGPAFMNRWNPASDATPVSIMSLMRFVGFIPMPSNRTAPLRS